ncbi:MAG TPA: hypothetical protein VIO13_07020 [Candidatus Dormibacteraeota bacterium]|jgi:hypothetical protein
MSNPAFPGTAETRADYLRELTAHIETRAVHLRELSEHMHALEWVNASLSDVENEVFELDVAMNVYRRFTGETDHSATRSEEPLAAATKATPARREGDAPEGGGAAPTFSQFALTHLDPGGEIAGRDRPLETASQDPNGVRPSWLTRQSDRGAESATP